MLGDSLCVCVCVCVVVCVVVCVCMCCALYGYTCRYPEFDIWHEFAEEQQADALALDALCSSHPFVVFWSFSFSIRITRNLCLNPIVTFVGIFTCDARVHIPKTQRKQLFCRPFFVMNTVLIARTPRTRMRVNACFFERRLERSEQD